MQRKIGTAIHHAALPFYLLRKANGTAQENRGSEMKKMSFFSQGDGEGKISTNTCNCTKNGEKLSQKEKEKYIISEEES